MATASVNGTTLFYSLKGAADAPVLVLSASLGTHHGMWNAQLAAFTRRFRVLRYDTRGHGASAVPQGPYGIETLGRDVLALLDELDIPRASFCGLSLGGMAGMWLAAHAPGRMERLVLANTSSYVGPPEPWNQRIELVKRGGMAAITEGILEKWFTPSFHASSPAEVDRIRRMLLATSPEGYIACGIAVRDMDLRADLAAIRAPALVVCGTHDRSTPPEAARYIASRIAGARLVELPAAHLSNIEAQAAFDAAVTGFLEGRA